MEQCENAFKDMLTWRKIQFTRVCADAAFVRRVSIGMSFKTIPDVDDGFGDRSSACREYTLPREDPNSRIHAMIKGKLQLDQFFKFILHDILTSSELKF